ISVRSETRVYSPPTAQDAMLSFAANLNPQAKVKYAPLRTARSPARPAHCSHCAGHDAIVEIAPLPAFGDLLVVIPLFFPATHSSRDCETVSAVVRISRTFALSFTLDSFPTVAASHLSSPP